MRFYTDQRLIPRTVTSSHGVSMEGSVMRGEASPSIQRSEQEETKLTSHVASKQKLEPSYPEPHEDMIVKVESRAGRVEVADLTFRLN